MKAKWPQNYGIDSRQSLVACRGSRSRVARMLWVRGGSRGCRFWYRRFVFHSLKIIPHSNLLWSTRIRLSSSSKVLEGIEKSGAKMVITLIHVCSNNNNNETMNIWISCIGTTYNEKINNEKKIIAVKDATYAVSKRRAEEI